MIHSLRRNEHGIRTRSRHAVRRTLSDAVTAVTTTAPLTCDAIAHTIKVQNMVPAEHSLAAATDMDAFRTSVHDCLLLDVLIGTVKHCVGRDGSTLFYSTGDSQ